MHTHKQQTHIAKGIEKTFDEQENICLFIRRHELKYGKLSSYSDGRKLTQLTSTKWTQQFFFHESSFEAAKALLIDCKESVNQHFCHPPKYGCCLGGWSRKAFVLKSETSCLKDVYFFLFKRGSMRSTKKVTRLN